jgi:hypothetical protein
MFMATVPRLETNGAGEVFPGAWQTVVLTELAVGLSEAFANAMTEWAALQSEMWSRSTAIQSEWTKALTGQTLELPPWMIWHNGTEQLA